MLSEQERKELKKKIKSSQHEIFVVSIEEMDAIVRSSPKGNLPHVKNAWRKLKGKAEVGATYYASVDDLRTLSKLVGDLGGVATKSYIKKYGGKPHIILKGNPGLRRVLTGTKYGIKNPKVVTMGLGKAGAVHAAKTGGLVSIILLSGYRITDYFLADESTLSQLIGSLATDVVKVGLATGASIGAASALVASGVTLAIGPIVAVVVVGVVASMALSVVDEKFGITDKVIDGIDEVSESAKSYVDEVKEGLQERASEALASVIDYAIDTSKQAVVDFAKHKIERFMPRRPRVY